MASAEQTMALSNYKHLGGLGKIPLMSKQAYAEIALLMIGSALMHMHVLSETKQSFQSA